ncbi:MAG: DUF4845 domain-containing protein [Candidatus Competibacterales bacterium]
MEPLKTANVLPPSLKQRGITLFGAIFLVSFIVIIAIIAMKVSPIYLDYFGVRSTLYGMRDEPGIESRSPRDIYRTIEKRFNISYVSVIKPRDVKIKSRNGRRFMLLQYQDRRNVFGNLDVVAVFDEEIPLTRQ